MKRLEVEILTLFPRMCEGYLGESILGKARESGLLDARVTDIREHASGKHRVTGEMAREPSGPLRHLHVDRLIVGHAPNSSFILLAARCRRTCAIC